MSNSAGQRSRRGRRPLVPEVESSQPGSSNEAKSEERKRIVRPRRDETRLIRQRDLEAACRLRNRLGSRLGSTKVRIARSYFDFASDPQSLTHQMASFTAYLISKLPSLFAFILTASGICLIPFGVRSFSEGIEIKGNPGDVVRFTRFAYDPVNTASDKPYLTSCKSDFDEFLCAAVNMNEIMVIVMAGCTVFGVLGLVGFSSAEHVDTDIDIPMPKALRRTLLQLVMFTVILSNVAAWLDYAFFTALYTDTFARYVLQNYPSIIPGGTGRITLPDNKFCTLFVAFHTVFTALNIIALKVQEHSDTEDQGAPPTAPAREGEVSISLAEGRA